MGLDSGRVSTSDDGTDPADTPRGPVADPDLLDDALDLINAAIGAPFTVASRIDDGRFTVVGIADRLDTPFRVGREFDCAETFCVRIAETGTEEAVPAVAGDDRLSSTYPHTALGLDAYLGVPIEVGGEFYGTVAVCDTEPRAFDEADRRRVRTSVALVERAIGGE